MPKVVKHPLLAGALVAALAFSACGGEDAQRAGGASPATATELTLANGNGQPDELQAFAKQVEKLSDGRLRIKFSNGWRSGEKHYEQGLFADVKAGKADLGWVGSRVLGNMGVKAFDPLHAPFLVNSYEVEDGATSGKTAQRMLEALGPAGVTGVAVLPGPMRFLQLNRPVDGPDELTGLRIGLQDSPVGEATLKAFGAEPVEISSGQPIRGLDGVEAQIDSIAGNRYHLDAKYTVADLPLWPRPYVVFANTAAWDRLSEDDRRVIQEAADGARSEMLLGAVEFEQAAVASLCKEGDEMVSVGSGGRARMQAAVAPLMDRLRTDPVTRDSMAEIDSLRAGGSAHVLSCPASAGAGGDEALTGSFTTTLRESEPHSDAIREDWKHVAGDSVRMDLELSDGQAVMTEHYDEGPTTAFNLPYKVFKDVIEFGDNGSGPEFTARWRLDGGKLKFTDVGGAPGDKFVWTRTWTATD